MAASLDSAPLTFRTVPWPDIKWSVKKAAARKSSPESLALDWYHAPCSAFIHPHLDEGCLDYTVEIWKDTFRSALSMYTPLYTVTILATKRHPIELLRRGIPAVIRSSIFLATNTALYARWACTLLKLGGTKNRPIFFFLAPFLASFMGIFIEKAGRRRELAVYMTNQAVEACFKMLLARGWFTYTPFKDGKRMLFAFAIGCLYYFYNWHPQDLSPSVTALMRVLAGSQSHQSQPDWIETHIQKVTKPILILKKRSTSIITRRNQSKNSNMNENNTEGNLQSQNISPPPEVTLSSITTTTSTKTSIQTISSQSSTSSTSSSPSPSLPTIFGSESAIAPEQIISQYDNANLQQPTLPDTVGELLSSQFLPDGYSSSRLMYCINGFVRGFLVGYACKFALSFIPKLFNPMSLLKNWKSIFTKALGKPSLELGIFLSILVGLPRIVKIFLCSIFSKRQPSQQQQQSQPFSSSQIDISSTEVPSCPKWVDLVAGMAGGCIASLVLSSTEITMYIASKVSEAFIEKWVREGRLPSIPYFVEILYGVSVGIMFYSGILEPWTVRNSYVTFLAKASGNHYTRMVHSDGGRALRIQTGMEKLHAQYLLNKKAS